MRLNVIILFVLTGILSDLLTPTVPAQVIATGRESGGIPLAVGLGASDYDVDWGHGRMLGGTIWINYTLDRVPTFMQGLGIETEARDISINHSSTQPSNFRLDTVGGGPIYFLHLQRVPNLQPYGKLMVSFGGIDWNNPNPQFTHETRTVTAPGIGFEYRLYRNILFRGDYEYQFWPDIALMGPGSHFLNPQGFTFGVMYDFHDQARAKLY